MSEAASLKQQAAEKAVEAVESGMVVGLGHGSTAVYAVRRIAELLRARELRDVVGIPCSTAVEVEARRVGIRLTTLEEHPAIDITIDGADELTPRLELIKGGGGALLREKVVAQASRREIIVADESKVSPKLGTQWAVPVEVVPFGWSTQMEFFESLGAEPKIRTGENGAPFKTDQGNLIVDCRFGPMEAPADLARAMAERAGVVEHGLFLNLATEAIIAGTGGVRVITT